MTALRELRLRLGFLDAKRREALNKILDIKGKSQTAKKRQICSGCSQTSNRVVWLFLQEVSGCFAVYEEEMSRENLILIIIPQFQPRRRKSPSQQPAERANSVWTKCSRRNQHKVEQILELIRLCIT